MRRTRDRLATDNERVKLFAGFFNTLGVGFIGFAFIRPWSRGSSPSVRMYWCSLAPG